MDNGLKLLSPKDGYIAYLQAEKSEVSVTLLAELYQPVMGVQAFATYFTLVDQSQKKPLLSERKLLGDLLCQLDMEVPTFYATCSKLEALGLLRTFEKNDNLGRVFIYQLLLPQDGPHFFADAILAGILYEMVGENRFKRLQNRFSPPDFKHGGRELTKNFMDVFNLSSQQLFKPSEVKAAFEPQPLITQNEVSLDLQYLKQLLNSSYLGTEDVLGHLDDLKAAKLLYNLDEAAMVALLERCFNVANNRVDFVLFNKKLKQEFQIKVKQLNVKRQSPATMKPDLNQEQLTQTDQQLAQACAYYTPLEFLALLKKEQGGYVSTLENYVVSQMVKSQILPNAVINVVMHYLLVDEDNDLLTSKVGNRFEALCSRLAKKKIDTPQKAMIYLKQAQKNKPLPTKPTYKNKQTRPVVQKERPTDWKKIAQQNAAKVTPDMMQEKLANLEKLRQELQDDE